MNRNNRLHLIYGIVVLCLCAILWYTQHQQSQALSLMARQYEVSEDGIHGLQGANIVIKAEIDEQIRSYNNPVNRIFGSCADSLQTLYAYVTNGICKMKQVDTTSRDYNGKFSLIETPKSRLSDFRSSHDMWRAVRANVAQYKAFVDSALFSVGDRDGSYREIKFQNLLENEAFWHQCETLPSIMSAQSANLLLEQLTADHQKILNEIYGRVKGKCGPFFKYHAAIAPRVGSVTVGDDFDADLYLSEYGIFQCDSDVEVRAIVNGKEYPMVDGLISFKEKATKPGKKMVKAEIRLRNKYNGTVETYNSEYQYLVLPR